MISCGIAEQTQSQGYLRRLSSDMAQPLGGLLSPSIPHVVGTALFSPPQGCSKVCHVSAKQALSITPQATRQTGLSQQRLITVIMFLQIA